jgi:BirA family biotin operon repressor/biotin-[acetyl-CoA-carboxylase] ligase
VTGTEFGHGFRLLELASIGSTNDLARRLAEAGEPAGLFVRAERQTAGRGRHGRTWQSPPGNLYASLLLRPTRPAAEVASLSLVTALALAEAVETLSEGRIAPRLKWPNDVLVDGAKLAGILLENVAEGRGRAALIIGIGVNVGWAPEADLPYRATSLSALGVPQTPRRVLTVLGASLRFRLDRWERDGFAAMREDWLARAAVLGSQIEVRIGDRIVQGWMAGLDPHGALCLERADGTLELLSAGEIMSAHEVSNGLARRSLER